MLSSVAPIEKVGRFPGFERHSTNDEILGTRRPRYNTAEVRVIPFATGLIATMSSNITTAKRKASAGSGLFVGEWHERVEAIVEAMREMSLQDDPLKMVQAYGARVRDWMPADRWMSLSRRGHKSPDFRITRSSLWSETIDPWKQKERLPLLSGGFLADLIYGDEPRLINDISPLVSPDDPARQYLEGMRSMIAVPHYDQGEGLNMVISMREKPGSFEPERFPEWVWVSGLFGRATHNLVLRNELKDAYDIVERELKVVADIQRSLLPQVLPKIPSLELSAYYRTSRWAGGDYYDFFPLPDGRWGILVADVSGHGTPAAVMMAITHSLAHSLPGPPDPPAALLGHLNRQLSMHYTVANEVFVTAFYGIYDPAARTLSYSSAGHNPPRLIRCRDGTVQALEEVGGPPLGLDEDLTYEQTTCELQPGDVMAFYTDGITEAMDSRGAQFGPSRLDEILSRCHLRVGAVIEDVIDAVDRFTDSEPPMDDRTLIVARVV
jgi:phosphoserine phosphatase RsbU/P